MDVSVSERARATFQGTGPHFAVWVAWTLLLLQHLWAFPSTVAVALLVAGGGALTIPWLVARRRAPVSFVDAVCFGTSMVASGLATAGFAMAADDGFGHIGATAASLVTTFVLGRSFRRAARATWALSCLQQLLRRAWAASAGPDGLRAPCSVAWLADLPLDAGEWRVVTSYLGAVGAFHEPGVRSVADELDVQLKPGSPS